MKTYALALADIEPGKNPAYSPNLHKWVGKHSHFYADGGTLDTVWRVREGADCDLSPGTMFIGYIEDDGAGMFIGCRLMNALCEGRTATRWAYTNVAPHLEPIENFWEQYKRLGRCAVDPDHHVPFASERWREAGDHRTCMWCGHQQHRERWTEQVERSAWVNQTPEVATC